MLQRGSGAALAVTRPAGALTRGLAAALCLTALALSVACDRRANDPSAGGVRPSTVVEPEMRVDEVAQEEPAVARSRWRLANDVARSVTGNLQVSLAGARGGPIVLAFASGITMRAQPIAVTPASNRSGVGDRNFAQVLGGNPQVDAHMYRVQDETVAQAAAAGGLCGPSRVTHIVISEFVDPRGRWVFKLAAFKGEGPPGVSGVDPEFCATYAYEAP
ncbi:MAG: hypothetical protein ABW199_09810 [Caulobacterales bacterium]